MNRFFAVLIVVSQFAVLSGDPAKGAYTQMRKLPAGTDNPLHSHSSELKNVRPVVRGFSPINAGNLRLDGLYIDRQTCVC